VLYLKPQNNHVDDPALLEAAHIMRSGGIVAFPTETVYGLGARYDDETAVAKIFAAKGRPVDNPLIAHICELEQLDLLVRDWSPLAEKLAETFWPGPLTIVVPKRESVSDFITCGLDTVGVRMPDHELALALIRSVGLPVVAPSANRSGKPSPTTAAHVQEDLNGRIDAVLDGGSTEVGLESTVVGIYGNEVTLFRPGAVTVEMLEEVSGVKVSLPLSTDVAPPSPGMKYTHYAPAAKVYLAVGQGAERIWEISQVLQDKGERVVVLAFEESLQSAPCTLLFYSMGSRHDLSYAAHNLYGLFRLADSCNATILVVEAVYSCGLGQALMNRLYKAASVVVEG